MNKFWNRFRPILGWVTVIVLLTFPILSVSGALSMFMKITNIPGESTDKTHPNEINVLSWSWGMNNSGTTHSGTGSGGGKANVQDFSFTKYLDKASPNLMLAALKGDVINLAELTVVRVGPKGNYDYLKLKLENVLVTSVNGGGNDSQDKLTETVTLNFSKFTLTYKPVRVDGSFDSDQTVTYDIAATVSN